MNSFVSIVIQVGVFMLFAVLALALAQNSLVYEHNGRLEKVDHEEQNKHLEQEDDYGQYGNKLPCGAHGDVGVGTPC